MPEALAKHHDDLFDNFRPSPQDARASADSCGGQHDARPRRRRMRPSRCPRAPRPPTATTSTTTHERITQHAKCPPRDSSSSRERPLTHIRRRYPYLSLKGEPFHPVNCFLEYSAPRRQPESRPTDNTRIRETACNASGQQSVSNRNPARTKDLWNASSTHQ